MRKERGITLVALVVTIIVLLILAGVGLSLTIGQNGIAARSKNAVFTHNEAVKNEEEEMNSVIDEFDQIAGNNKPAEPSAGESGYEGSGSNDPYIPEGYNHTTGTVDTGYVIQDENQNEFIWIPVDGSSLQLARIDYASGTSFSDCNETKSDLDPFKASVANHGGFYLARYEAGIPESMTTALSTASDSARNVAGTPVSKKNAIPWNYISQTQSKTNAESFSKNSSYPSILVNSYIWDTTLQWIISNDITLTQVNSDSRSWGNYYDSQPTGITKYGMNKGASWIMTASTTKALDTYWLLPAGHTNYTAQNNIYDLAGNLWEWTTEINSSNCVYRGGGYSDSGMDFPAAYRSSNAANNTSYGIGFRFALYKA